MAASQTQRQSPVPDECLAEARRLIERAQFELASDQLEALLGQELDRHHESEALYTLAVAQRYGRKLRDALRTIEALIEVEPGFARAHQERGHTLLALNDPESAAMAYTQAVSLNPGLVASMQALANLHERAGRHGRANAANAQLRYLQSLAKPLVAVIDLTHEGKLLKADALCRGYLKDNPRDAEGIRILADIATRLRYYAEAEFLLESAVELDANSVRARSDYMRILNRKGKFDRALAEAEKLLEAQPDNPAFMLGKASALNGLGRLDEAIELFRLALERSSNKAEIYVMLGHAKKTQGKLDEAIAAYRQAYALKPDHGDAYWSLANTKTYRFSDEELERAEQQSGLEGVTTNDRVHLNFAIGKALEDRGEYERSFDYYARGNALKMSRARYDPSVVSALVDAQVATCTQALFEARGDLGFAASDPIFIVGLPRAGSTLLEQVLASHSMVDGTMELHNILGLAQRLRQGDGEMTYPQLLGHLDDDYFERFGRQFIHETRAYRGSAPRFIDKMPNNFMHIGLIRLILPNAKVIDARRDPMACGFSCFKQLFGEGQDFSYSLDTIGRYYADYVRLMDHWDVAIPGFVLRVQHEDVVDDLETEVRRILEFCGLPFEEACLEFYKTERQIKTPSSEQVRQPIYRSGLEKWRNYERWLEPLKRGLGTHVRSRFGID